MLAGRSLVAPLIIALAFGLGSPVVSAAPLARLLSPERSADLLPVHVRAGGGAGLAARDTGWPNVSGERDGEVTALPTSQATTSAGKPARLGDVQREGSVVAVFEDPADPLIVIAVENGYVTVRLRCGPLCPSIHLGDYVVVEGRRRSEAVLDANEVWVVTP